MSTIGVIAVLKIQEGQEAAFEEAFTEVAAQVREKEAGTLLYDLFKDMKDPGTYYVQEQYADMASLEAHGKTDYFQAFSARIGGLLAGKPQIHLSNKVD
jgi:quinol monooxygenase YgiN